MDYTKQYLQLRLYKNICQGKHQLPGHTYLHKISFHQTNVRVKEQQFERIDTSLSTSRTTRTCNYLVRKEHKAVNENPSNYESSKSNSQRNTQTAFHRSEKSLLQDFGGLKFSSESMEDFAEVVMLDFAGQYDFYATHQTFLNKHAVYLLVLDISKDLKGISEDLDNALPDLAEIPLKDIGGKWICNESIVYYLNELTHAIYKSSFHFLFNSMCGLEYLCHKTKLLHLNVDQTLFMSL